MIKRVALLLTALTLALTLSLGMLTVEASAAPAWPGSSAEAAKLCQDVASEFPEADFNTGECVNFIASLRTGNTSRFIVGVCGSDFFREVFLESLGIDPNLNKGQCISMLQAFARAEQP